MRSYIAAFALATVIATILTPLVLRMALRVGAVAEGGGRHVHEQTIPRLGGVAICVALLTPIVAMLFVDAGAAKAFKAQWLQTVGMCVGGAMICLVGAYDDTRGIRALYKLYLQIGVAVLAFACGFRIDAVGLPFVGTLQMGIFALPATVLWIVGVTNAVNLIDGLDGLAAGVVFFAGVTNLVIALLSGHVLVALTMAALLGALVGFLFYNFNPARIFMGDSGSYLLGFIMSVTALFGTPSKTSTAVSLLVPVIALGVPIFDTLFAMARRVLERRPMFSPDRGHIHHRLLELGITHRRAVLILYGCSVVFTLAAIGIHLGKSWQVGLGMLASTVILAGMARSVGRGVLLHRRLRSKARIRSRDTELLRRAVPQLMTRVPALESEEAIFEQLAQFAEQAELESLQIRHGDGEVMNWLAPSTSRRTTARMTYPLGRDSLAQARMHVSVVSGFENPTMCPETEILLQLVADSVTAALVHLESDLAPRQSILPEPARASRPSGELAVKLQ